jgi:hypothetical protein
MLWGGTVRKFTFVADLEELDADLIQREAALVELREESE